MAPDAANLSLPSTEGATGAKLARFVLAKAYESCALLKHKGYGYVLEWGPRRLVHRGQAMCVIRYTPSQANRGSASEAEGGLGAMARPAAHAVSPISKI